MALPMSPCQEFLRRTWSQSPLSTTSTVNLESGRRTGANERNGIPFATLDEANDHAKQLRAKARRP
jgi:hypothetical protein